MNELIKLKIIRKLFFFVCMAQVSVFIISAQTGIRITGTVFDDYGEALPGVSVVVKGTPTGTATNVNGEYTITVPDGASVLQFTFIGFQPQEVVVGGQRNINVTLQEIATEIDEVVVIGYGTQKKMTVTGAVSQVGTRELLKAPVPNLGNALAGNLTGLSAVQFSGQPGIDDPTIFIRGIGSLDAARSAPLFMVDGVERSFFRIDPNEVESVTVLKDASSTAVFGVRGANGVILVTTRRGHSGKPVISVSTSAGIQMPVLRHKFADSYEVGILVNEAMRNDGTPEDELPFKSYHLDAYRTGSNPLVYSNTDWVNYLVRRVAPQTQHNINISGGTDRVKYFTSVGVFTQDGLFKPFDEVIRADCKYQRYNYRANLDIDVTSSTLLKINLGGIVGNTRQPFYEGGLGIYGPYHRLKGGFPFAGAGYHDGKIITCSGENIPFFAEAQMRVSDLLFLLYNYGYQDIMRNDLNMDLSLTQKLDVITKGLSFTVKGSYNSAYSHLKNRDRRDVVYSAYLDDEGETYFRQWGTKVNMSYSEGYSRERNWYLEGSLNYARSFGKHNVSALALYNQWRDPYPVKFSYVNIPRGYVGFVGRATYDFDNRYLFDFNVGYNGSENFAPGRRYGLFPALSIGWVISQEGFMQGIDFIDHLKVRASYGLVGNDIYSSARFFYLPDAYSPYSGGYSFGHTITQQQPIATEMRLGNPLVTWEKAQKQNIGIDFTILKQRLTGSFDYFTEKRRDILTSYNVIPAHVAAPMPVANIGKVDNKGYEVVLNWNHPIGDFKYNIGFNVSYARNTVVYKDEIPRSYPWRQETGKPVGQLFGHVFDGYVTQERINSGTIPEHNYPLQPGDFMYKNLTADMDGAEDTNVIDDDDIRDIGFSIYPQLVGGFRVGFGYKNFDLSTMWTGAARVSRFLSGGLRIPFGNTRTEVPWAFQVKNRWTPETADTATEPRMSFNNATNNYRDSDFWLKDASYLRLKNIQIGYSFHGARLSKIGISSLRLYVTGENLLTFDYIKVVDPEQADGSTLHYPVMKVMNMGINFSF